MLGDVKEKNIGEENIIYRLHVKDEKLKAIAYYLK